ncbi:hypothetical protein GR238_34455 [Rhizobium leguminosarum]|uniref:hypothetical protein n=1 Tax=Rhizobium ruizarguesonis TaxID=2081791 RepID=UPI0013BC0268|nr:hypothetical protein [Rhizobium ruizarguesonis]NEJ10464.1 hypothetical protein [Rhizobium ruizarguesonis]
MPTEINTPPLTAKETVLVDWLEFIAFLDPYGVARLDPLISALEQQKEEHEDNIEEQDKMLDQLREKIENEVDFREKGCGGGYPFKLSDDAEELSLVEGWQDSRFSFYLVCLLTSHLNGSEIMEKPFDQQLVIRLRDRVFQILSVITMAGVAGGSAASIGWPRQSQATIIQILKQAEQRGAGFIARDKPGRYRKPKEKDGGIDVISWSIHDRPPPMTFYYAQVASGENWHGKPVIQFVETFERNYMDDPPRSNRCYATIIPFRDVDVNDWWHEHSVHRSLIDRTRVPAAAVNGLKLAESGIEMDEIQNLAALSAWVADVRQSLI